MGEHDTDDAEILAVIEAAEAAELRDTVKAAEGKGDKKTFEWQALWKAVASLPEKGDDLLAVINGFIGDRMEKESSPLALRMTLFVGARELDLAKPLADQVPSPSAKVVVFVHGLMCTPNIWKFPSGRRRSIGERLEEDEGITPVLVRYNTGRHISTNGRELASMLDALVSAWPVPVEEVDLVGYSMGGLVARSAAHYASEGKLRWVELLARMFLIGVPLRGSPVEQLFHIATYTLKTVPNPITWIIAWVFRQRSAGIKDLRHGFIVDEEWRDQDVDTLTFGRRFKIPLTPGVEHFVVAGNLANDEHHPLAKTIGDALVTPWSAKDEGFDGTPTERAAKGARVFPGLGHISIINDDAVYAQILAWWRGEEAPAV